MIFIKKNKMKILSYLFSFKGRLDRMTYIVSIIGWMVVFRLFLGNFFQKFSAIEPNPENALSVLIVLGLIGLFYILGLVIWASVVVRRLHDFDLSGWWLLAVLLVKFLFKVLFPVFPLVSFRDIEMLLVVLPTKNEKNRFDLKQPEKKTPTAEQETPLQEKRIDFKL